MRTVLLLLTVLVAPAWAQSTPPPEQLRLERLLQAHHATPARARLEAEAGAQTPKLLRAIATDPLALPPVRGAALDALRAWPDAQTWAVYTTALAPQQPRALRHKVLAFLPAFGAQAVEPLQAALVGPDAGLAQTALEALFQVDAPEADKALRDAASKVSPRLRPQVLEKLAQRASVR